MGDSYTKEYQVYCPRTQQRTVHVVEYARATCTRVPDTMQHFYCARDGRCKDCEKDYME